MGTLIVHLSNSRPDERGASGRRRLASAPCLDWQYLHVQVYTIASADVQSLQLAGSAGINTNSYLLLLLLFGTGNAGALQGARAPAFSITSIWFRFGFALGCCTIALSNAASQAEGQAQQCKARPVEARQAHKNGRRARGGDSFRGKWPAR